MHMLTHISLLSCTVSFTSNAMKLLDLPLDVYVYLCCFIDPLDIISLSQTCSKLRVSSHERHIWTSALKTMCHRNLIPATTFKTAELSVEELKHSSTAPSRLLSKILKGSTITLDATVLPSLCPQSVFKIYTGHPLREFSRACLIPGGRFLLAYDGASLILHDLGTSKPVTLKGDRLLIDGGEDFLFTPCSDPINGEIRVLMSKSREHGSTWSSDSAEEIVVIRFIFDDEENRFAAVVFQRISSVALKSTIGRGPFTLVKDLVIFRGLYNDNTTLGVWNYMENTFAIWNICPGMYREIFLDGSHIALITPSSLIYWKIPPLKPVTTTQSELVEEILPARRITLEWPEGYDQNFLGSTSRCTRLYDWYDTFKTLDSFNLLVNIEQRWQLVRFSIPQTDFSTSDTTTDVEAETPSLKVTVRSTAHLPSEDSRGGHGQGPLLTLGSSFLCNGWHVQPVLQGDKLYVYASPGSDAVTQSIAEEKADHIVELTLPRDGLKVTTTDNMLSRRYFNFDPISGRLAYIPEGSPSRILIVDYLKYPTTPPQSSLDNSIISSKRVVTSI
ncbi:hypothetical protein BJ165DRAFT_1591832 [Panaeolus papilionaceus]|nr:hypothetical protein BJ165DRAFT_1591832 [Panaeolus papilionaceus]